MVHVLVPLKDLVAAKTRLSGLLSPSERRSLAQAMVEDVLAVVTNHPRIERVTLVSDDPVASMLAAQYGASCLPESDLGQSGLNSVVTAAVAHVLQQEAAPVTDQGALELLVLHGDLPLLDAADIDAVLDQRRAGDGLLIASDSHGFGSNLLAFTEREVPVFAFGQDSCAKHLAWAHSAGVNVQVLRRPGLELDVDEPADLSALINKLTADSDSKTAQLLFKKGLIARLTLAIDSLSLEATSAKAKPQIGTDLILDEVQQTLGRGELLTNQQALALSDTSDTATLAAIAGRLRDHGHGNLITYSRKVFIPLTHLCRDVCHYCTFAKTPKKIDQPYMPVDEVLELCRKGAAAGCQEALFTLGEKPELRYSAARAALKEMGFSSTLDYVRHVAERVLAETGLLPHINAGCMTADEIDQLRPVSASMGIMLESASARLCEKGMPHYGSPDKNPAVRLQTMELAGKAAVPFTSGILIGIGETRLERIESLLALRDVHMRYGHLQEVIVQNFRAKAGTLMAQAPEPDLDELLWTIAVTRMIFGAQMNIQAPPNLSPGVLPQLVAAGINDWGGVSPLTPDHVNPEAPWPHLEQLQRETAAADKFLEQRLTIYPQYARAASQWLDPALYTAVLRHSDSDGFARRDAWVPGEECPTPEIEARLLDPKREVGAVSPLIRDLVQRCRDKLPLSEEQVTSLFQVRGEDFSYVVREADQLRRETCGEQVSYVVNRNINYTNVCYFKCQFCAFSKGKMSENLRGRPYDISGEEIASRCSEAWQRGATEVCMQGGIHPDYTGQTYLDILHTVRTATPEMHIHAFSPLEVWQGAETLGLDIEAYLLKLKAAGLNTLPGTAAEILHEEVRGILCPDKLNSEQWLQVMETAHRIGLRTTATIMYGHIDRPHHWAHHLLKIKELQLRTGGFTEFVPLPFVHMEAPMYLKGNARRGPSFREALLMHSVSRLVFHGAIENIQASWVKMGEQGVAACLNAGVNDLGGTLMNESITRAAGSGHGQEWEPLRMEAQIRSSGREPIMRTTLYQQPPEAQRKAALEPLPLVAVNNDSAAKLQRSKRIEIVDVSLVPHRESALEKPSAQVFLMDACN